MPTYEYRCRECGHEFEAVQSFSDNALTECPQCAGTLRKVFGSIGVSFKGTGFYKTDHGSRAKAGASSGAATDGSSSSSESSGSAESSGSSGSSSSTTSPATTPSSTPSTSTSSGAD